jgi:hypothetical protein
MDRQHSFQEINNEDYVYVSSIFLASRHLVYNSPIKYVRAEVNEDGCLYNFLTYWYCMYW